MDVYQRRRLVALSAIAVAFILFVLLIRGCGGDDDEATPTPLTGATGTGGVTVLAQADYVAQADPICLQANTQLAAVDESDPVQADNDKADIVAGELQQLQTLPPPDDGTDKLDKFLAALETQSAAYADRATANERGDSATVVELDTTIDDAVTEAGNVGAKFGFEACGDLSKVGEATTGGGGGGDDSGSDTGGTATPVEPVTPTTTTPIPVAPPPTDGGGTATPAPAPAPPADDGGGDSSSGGVSP